jgi:hypothetical protein
MPVEASTVWVTVFSVLTDWLELTSKAALPLIPKPSIEAWAATVTEASILLVLTEPLLCALPLPWLHLLL